MKIRTLTAITLTLILSGVSAQATSLSNVYSSFWVLGDSLSDNGNLYAATGYPPPPYYNGQFSNGPVWDVPVAAQFSTSGNFAYGGALASADTASGIPGLATQVGYLGTQQAAFGSNPLASILIGANDMFGAIQAAAADPTNATSILGGAVTNAVGAISTALDNLAGLGIQNVEVWNLPNLGATPVLNGSPASASLGDAATTMFNSALATMLAAHVGSGQDIGQVNLYGLFQNALTNPAAFGYSDVTDACLSPTLAVCSAPDSYLFWDGVHPTEPGQQAMAALFTSVVPVPLPAGGLLLACGFGFLLLMGRRGSRAAI